MDGNGDLCAERRTDEWGCAIKISKVGWCKQHLKKKKKAEGEEEERPFERQITLRHLKHGHSFQGAERRAPTRTNKKSNAIREYTKRKTCLFKHKYSKYY